MEIPKNDVITGHEGESYQAGAARDDQENGGKGTQSYEEEAAADVLRDDTAGKGTQSYEEEAAEDEIEG